jgi:predicted  nucleic acid-binding Zn-ribbon protein
MAIVTTSNNSKESNVVRETLKLTSDMEATDLDVALDNLAKTLAGLLKNMDDLQTNLSKLTDQNKRLKKAVVDLSRSPMADLERILNEK